MFTFNKPLLYLPFFSKAKNDSHLTITTIHTLRQGNAIQLAALLLQLTHKKKIK